MWVVIKYVMLVAEVGEYHVKTQVYLGATKQQCRQLAVQEEFYLS